MIKYDIRAPIWKTMSVGLANYKLKDGDTVEVNILYVDRFGEKIFPNPYKMSVEKVRTYPTQAFGKVLVHIVPLVDMEEKLPLTLDPTT